MNAQGAGQESFLFSYLIPCTSFAFAFSLLFLCLLLLLLLLLVLLLPLAVYLYFSSLSASLLSGILTCVTHILQPDLCFFFLLFGHRHLTSLKGNNTSQRGEVNKPEKERERERERERESISCCCSCLCLRQQRNTQVTQLT